jgi:hypothetical protein
MLLDPNELTTLCTECLKLKSNPAYRSPELYLIFHVYFRRLFCKWGFSRVPPDVQSDAEYDAIRKLHKALPKYDSSRADAARIARGLPLNTARGIATYVEHVAHMECLSTLARYNRWRSHYRTLSLNVPIRYDDGSTSEWEIADLNSDIVDVDNRIDEEARVKRAKAFVRRLDTIERINTMPADPSIAIAKSCTKAQLVQRALQSVEVLSKVMALIALALPKPGEVVPDMPNGLKSKEVRRRAVLELQEIHDQWVTAQQVAAKA